MSDMQALTTLLSGLDSSSSSGGMSGATVWGIIAVILAITGSILIYFLFVRPNTEQKGFVKTLKDFLSFKTDCLEALLKLFYYGMTIYTILTSFTLLSYGSEFLMMFFSQLIFMPIVYRLLFELGMALCRISHNTTKMAEKK